MKIFIWCLTFLVATIFNVLLGYATGWKVGYFLFYTLVYFVASRLCRIWDTHKANQQKNDTSYGSSHPVSSVEETPPIASADIFHHPDTTQNIITEQPSQPGEKHHGKIGKWKQKHPVLSTFLLCLLAFGVVALFLILMALLGSHPNTFAFALILSLLMFVAILVFYINESQKKKNHLPSKPISQSTDKNEIQTPLQQKSMMFQTLQPYPNMVHKHAQKESEDTQMETKKDPSNGSANSTSSFSPPSQNQPISPEHPSGNGALSNKRKGKVNPLAIVIPACAVVCIALSFLFYHLGFSNSSSYYPEKYDEGYDEGYGEGASRGYENGYDEGYDEGFDAATEKFLRPVSFDHGKVYLKPSASCVAPFKVSTSVTDTYIYLDYEEDGRDIGFCVKANSTYERNVPLGTCRLYYATGGNTWYGTEYGMDYCFGEDTTWHTSNDTFSFTKDSNYYYGSEVILYPVEGGNWDTYEVSPSALPF